MRGVGEGRAQVSGDRSQVAHWLHMALRRGGSFVTSDPKEADAIFVAHYVRTP